jgi:hypothetical protein
MGSVVREDGSLAGGHRGAGDGSDAVSRKVDFICFLIDLGFHPFVIQTTFCSSRLTSYVTYEHNIFIINLFVPIAILQLQENWKPPFFSM